MWYQRSLMLNATNLHTVAGKYKKKSICSSFFFFFFCFFFSLIEDDWIFLNVTSDVPYISLYTLIGKTNR